MFDASETPTRALDYPTPSLHEKPHEVRINANEKQIKKLLDIVSLLEQELSALQEQVDNLP